MRDRSMTATDTAGEEFDGSDAAQGQGENDEAASPANDRATQVIMWRPSVRVRLATNLPPDIFKSLREGGSTKAAEGHARAGAGGPSGRANDEDPAAFRLPPLTRNKKKDSMGKRPPWNTKAKEPTKASARDKLRYGAWYLPVENWKVEKGPTRKGWEDIEYDGNQKYIMDDLDLKISAEQQEEEKRVAALTNYQAHLEHQLETLYSGKVYKEYIQRQGEKIPHYLQRVSDDPLKEMEGGTRRRSRRQGYDSPSAPGTQSLPSLPRAPSLSKKEQAAAP